MFTIRLKIIGRNDELSVLLPNICFELNRVNELSSIQNFFYFDSNYKPILLKEFYKDNFIHSDKIERIIGKYSTPGDNELTIFFSDIKMEGDLYALFLSGSCFISANYFSGNNIKTYIILTIVDCIATKYYHLPAHRESKGCISDYCAYGDLSSVFSTCNFCSDCLDLIDKKFRAREVGIEIRNSIFKILDYLKGRKYLFVLMPFAKEFDNVYSSIRVGFKKHLEWTCNRSDDLFKTANILDNLLDRIYRADLIIADLTNLNPNVFYELGIAKTLNKKIILLSQTIENIPFDLKQDTIIKYDNTIYIFHNN